MHFFGHQVLILFWTHLPCFFSILSVCMPGLFCSAAFWLVRIAYCRRLGRGAEKNRAIKRFRNRAISNRDFISISINRTALVGMHHHGINHLSFSRGSLHAHTIIHFWYSLEVHLFDQIDFNWSKTVTKGKNINRKHSKNIQSAKSMYKAFSFSSHWIRSSAINERNVCTSSTDNETAIFWLIQKGAFVQTEVSSNLLLTVRIEI